MKGMIKWIVLALVVFGLAFGGAYFFQQRVNQQLDGKVETIATASLQGLREQARLTAFIASFVAVVSSEQARFGLKAEQTMIMPGLVRYEVDLNALKPADVKWDKENNTLSVALPPLILSGPEVDLSGIRQYDGGGILMALTDAEATLDAANRKRGQDELLKQAKGEVPMRLARDATRNAIERSFAMPLRAAGIKATVVAKFAGE
ncbi:hypothetical protein BH11PSE5_BH11PSE5_27330 [soil metagenome]|jgi:hypothetical protein|uniref:DUF4230 domain-containing protein n=1 Tax=Sphingobium sp. CECT 9361 TaxID=2845384 RepID=UPI001E3B61DD|nr:DUF4230 domain-containing protein [Sphingobium sp. CECT 9361]CAH0350929.1 hypothetical protein SPH9361_01347 [Sphingobium sp. CECT 9361]